VLDQFEQWLHAKREEQGTELVQAVRHCDGQHVQCLVLVRDDFGMAITRFMHDLELPIVGGTNFDRCPKPPKRSVYIVLFVRAPEPFLADARCQPFFVDLRLGPGHRRRNHGMRAQTTARASRTKMAIA
jgi:hypothetical protein